MKIWTVTNQKGGAGKTVLVTNLAVEAYSRKIKTLIIDLDPQESATKWWEARNFDDPLLIKCKHNELLENIVLAEKQGFELVIIDTAGRDGLMYTEAIDRASFIIVPCQPSLDDCRSALPTVDLIKKVGKNFAFIITRCPTSGDDFGEAKNSLSAIGLVCDTPTSERKCFKRAYAENLAVSEYDPKDKGSEEIKIIFDYISQKEKRLQKVQNESKKG